MDRNTFILVYFHPFNQQDKLINNIDIKYLYSLHEAASMSNTLWQLAIVLLLICSQSYAKINNEILIIGKFFKYLPN